MGRDRSQGLKPAYKRYALALMAAVYTCNLLDRGLMGLLLQPIKEDLRLSDSQVGFVTGLAFALFYATLGVPIARWADRGNRVTITSMAIGLWGLTVMGSLFVSSFAQLVAARMLAAIGESGCKPPTYALLGDYFPEPAERVRAMSIYWMGAPIASLISYLLGGLLNEIYGWRIALFLIGIPGIILAFVVRFTLIEPREPRSAACSRQAPTTTWKVLLATLWLRRSCRHLTIALVLFFTMGFGITPWATVFMVRSHEMGTAELGMWWGLTSSLGGACGLLIGGYVTNRFFRDNERGQMRLSAIAISSTLPFYLAFLLASNKYFALLMLIPWMIAMNFFVAPTYTLMQRLVPTEIRATTMAFVMLLYNLIGMGVGPQMIGVVSDLMAPTFGKDGLRYAMVFMSLVALWSGYHFWQVGRTLKKDLADMALDQESHFSRTAECNASVC